jgi:hypothetical protein
MLGSRMLMHPDPVRIRLRGLLLVFLLPLALGAAQQHGHPAPDILGLVSFPTTCNPDVQKKFERGVALLHSFAYSPAENAFRSVAFRDPHCAIAHWGIAMSYFHQLWDPPIGVGAFSKGREEIRRAQQIGGGSQRERGFISALALVYEQDPAAIPYRTRVSQYETAMGKLAAAHPGDAESQVFYALALLANAFPFDKTHVNQKRAVRILSRSSRNTRDTLEFRTI